MAAEPSPDSALIMAQQGAPITRMPYDVLHSIFKSTKLGNAACLGLTCRQLYRHLKAYHPCPLSLGLCCCANDQGKCRQNYIKSILTCFTHYCGNTQSLGSQIMSSSLTNGYRLFNVNFHFTTLRLLNESVYGPAPLHDSEDLNIEEKQLRARFLDYQNARLDSRPLEIFSPASTRECRALGIEKLYLPCPAGKGHYAWKVEAFDAIRKDFYHKRHAKPEHWKRYWKILQVVEDNMEDFETMMNEETLRIGSNGSA